MPGTFDPVTFEVKRGGASEPCRCGVKLKLRHGQFPCLHQYYLTCISHLTAKECHKRSRCMVKDVDLALDLRRQRVGLTISVYYGPEKNAGRKLDPQ